ncbi:hypothetical protein B0H15DRAFT_955766 [Mycena belliarum]|uniref:Uncharacterized protein n=1 Tax=Mycena belliarum TaxID=1033014 RepID=A0AAD6TQN1_9AGAR|nr:hypothetical protein B0H15DRAFT_955766 [Mycena belliae]
MLVVLDALWGDYYKQIFATPPVAHSAPLRACALTLRPAPLCNPAARAESPAHPRVVVLARPRCDVSDEDGIADEPEDAAGDEPRNVDDHEPVAVLDDSE